MAKLVLREEFTATASEDFKNNRMIGARYVDKTALLASLLDGAHETTFFLRPRRFGKTLTLSMIRYFMEDTRDPELNEENRSVFQGLKILEMGEKYTREMTSCPVIHLTMQTVCGENFTDAWRSLKALIQDEYDRKAYLLQSDRLSENEKLFFQRVLKGKDDTGKRATTADYRRSLQNLTAFLRKESGKRVVVLIDEYDVPLEKAYQDGFYRRMVRMIGPLLQNVLKTNSENLRFAVITGCLRIGKEGIYTGLNNPEVNTVLSRGKNDVIGFTDEEVRKLLMDSGFGDRYAECAKWYDGYRFGASRIYNPWSVIKYIEDLGKDPQAPPMLHWAGTSSNAILRELAEHADNDTIGKADKLVQGENITFALRDDIVYDDLYRDPDNVFNVMLAAGYLTATEVSSTEIRARIPNKEVQQIYKNKFGEWFRESISAFDIRELYTAMEQGNTDRMEALLNERFLATMSYFDSKEAFYHGVMLALMQLNREYLCTSNRESGSGRFDLICKQGADRQLAYVLEFKVSEKPGQMEADARKAADQISEKGYVADLKAERYKRILIYGFAFCQKGCCAIRGKTFGIGS